MTGLAPEAPEPRRSAVSAVPDPAARLRLLVVGGPALDGAPVRRWLEEELADVHVDVVTGLAPALHHLADADYDLILADLTMPDAEAEAVVRTVRGALPQTPLMVVTGRLDGSLALWTLAVGAQGHLLTGERDGPRLAGAVVEGLQHSRAAQLARTRLESALELEREVVQRLRELDLAKDNFLATASHELRTPLTSIAAYAELLEDEPGLTSRQTEFVGAISRNATRLTALIEELLLTAGFDTTRHMETAEIDLRSVVTSCHDALAAQGCAKGLDVRLELPACPVLVTGDAPQLERAVLNLMSNAVKFTDCGGTVTCRLSVASQEACLVVTDTGRGIPEAEQAQLFTKFFRGAEAYDRAVQGAGLGLHVAATIVGDHGGDISVDSTAGRGTTFTMVLPALGGPGRVTARPVPIETLFARLVSLLGLRGTDPEVGDIAVMLDAALESARQTDEWELLGDALRFAHERLTVRGLVLTDLRHVGTAFERAAALRLDGVQRAQLRCLLASMEEPAPPPGEPGPGSEGIAYLELLLGGDRTGALSLARRWTADGMTTEEILLDILEPVQHELGRRWSLGLVTADQEHFCTAVTQLVMTDLQPGSLDRERAPGRGLVAVHAPGSMHHVGLRMVTDVLRCQGWSTVVVAGATVDTLIGLLVESASDLLLVSASMPSQIPSLIAMVRAVRQDPRTRGVKVVVGGRPFRVAPGLVDAVGADGWARDARSVAQVCRDLVGVPE